MNERTQTSPRRRAAAGGATMALVALVLAAAPAHAQQTTDTATATAGKSPREVADAKFCKSPPQESHMYPGGGGFTFENTAPPPPDAADSALVRKAKAEFDSLKKAGAAVTLPKARFVTCGTTLYIAKEE